VPVGRPSGAKAVSGLLCDNFVGVKAAAMKDDTRRN
jgi:hypothetical protein